MPNQPQEVSGLNIEIIRTVPLLLITGAKNLDPIRVVLEDIEPGKGRILIVCYTRAWTGYWGAMSGRTISDFFTRCDPDYLMSNLATGQRQTKSDAAYLIRIIEAVQTGLKLLKSQQ